MSNRYNLPLLVIKKITGNYWTLLDIIDGKIQIYFAYNSVQLNDDIPYNVQ